MRGFWIIAETRRGRAGLQIYPKDDSLTGIVDNCAADPYLGSVFIDQLYSVEYHSLLLTYLTDVKNRPFFNALW